MQDSAPVLMSYAESDREFAEKLANDLRKAGFVTHLQDEIQNANQCERLVVVVSQSAIDQETWQDVYEQFSSQAKLICPARVDMATLPPELEALDWVDFTLGYQMGVNGLNVALKMQPPTVPSSPIATLELPISVSRQTMLIGIVIAIVLLVIGLIVMVIVSNPL